MISGLVLILFLGVLESIGLPMELAIPAVIASVLVVSGELEGDVIFAVLSGLIIDIVNLHQWGVSSLVMLGLSTGAVLVKSRLEQRQPWSILGLGAVALMILMIIHNRGFDLGRWLIGVGVMIVWFRYLQKPRLGKGVVLKR